MSIFTQTMSRAVKLNDVLELLKLFEAEFNQPDLHDRVLIFDVVASRPENAGENERNENEARSQSKDRSNDETTKPEHQEIGVNANDESETESDDCEIASKYVNGNQQIENELSNEGEDDRIVTANHENETTPFDDEESTIEIQEANETEVTNKRETMLNENVEINQNTSNGNKMKDQHESETANDDSNRNPIPNHKEQSGHSNEISSGNNEAMSYPTKEGQIIRQHKFYVHSVWLAVQSSYFRSLFYSGTKESSAPEVHVHVQISESEEQVHLMLLEAMYKIDTLDNASVDELLEVLKLAQKYDVKFVFKKCKYCLETMVDSVEIFEKIIRFIKVDNAIADVEDLEKKLQSFLAKEFSPLDKTWQTTRFTELCEHSLKCLLSSDELVAASENTIFHALMYWIEQRGIENVLESQELPSLLSVVRFELIPIDYLYNIVQHNSVAKKLPDFNNHYLRGIYYHALSDTLKRRLPSQPVKRKANTESFIPYTWVIPRDELDKLVLTGNPLKSDKFWYCGYRMVLVISRVIKTRNLRGNKALFNATLSLEVINLAQQSEVMIQWQAASQSFISTPVVETATFEKKACMSSVDIRYVMEDKQEKVSSNVTGTTTIPGLGSSTSPFKPSGGFSFGPPEPSVTPTTVTPTGSSPSKPSGGLSFSPPESSVNTTAGTATIPGFGSSTFFSNPSGGLSLSSPKPSVNTTTGTATMSRFGSSTPPSNPNGGLSFSSPKPSVNTTAATATMSAFGSSTPPSNPSGGLSLSSPKPSVNTTTGTATMSRFGSSTPPSNPSGGLSLSSPKPSVNTTTGTATMSRFGSSTPPSNPSGGLSLSSPKPSVNTTTGTVTISRFGSSTPPSNPSGGLSLSSPKPSVNTTTGTVTISRFGSSTPPSNPSGGLSLSSPKPSVNTTTGTATMSRFGSSTPPSNPSGGLSLSSPKPSVNTTTGTATIPGFGSSTSFSNPNVGLSFSSPKPSVNTTTGTPTVSRFGPSTAPSIPSGGLGFSSTEPSVTSTTGTPTMPGFESSTPAPELRGGFSFGTPCTIASEASKPNASTFSFGATRRRNTTKARVPKQKSPNPLCLSIDVKMNLV